MKTTLLLLLIPLLPACTVNPFVATTSSGTHVASLGLSFLSKARAEFGEIKQADGSTISYGRTGKNEVSVANSYTAMLGSVELGKAVSNNTTSVLKSKEVTTRQAQAGAEATKQAQIQATKEVEVLKLTPEATVKP